MGMKMIRMEWRMRRNGGEQSENARGKKIG